MMKMSACTRRSLSLLLLLLFVICFIITTFVTAQDGEETGALEADDEEGSWYENFSEGRRGKAIVYASMIGGVVVVRPILVRFKRTRGRSIIYHGLFVALGAVLVLLLPDWIAHKVFSEAGVLIIGTLIPVYESIVAACTIGEEDDTAWLQFWVVNASLTYATEFIDTIKEKFPAGGEHWYEFEFLLTLWLMLPMTDGAALIYDKFTEPFIAPLAQKAKKLMEGWYSIIATAVNSSYLWLVWWAFMTLPEPARRFVVVAVGTIYPLMASTVAITTTDGLDSGLDDTYWLVYWACFSLVFIAMDYLETFVGSIKGFYSICLVLTIWLFLPMFEGAKCTFRNILVPISGQYENMLLHDAYLVRLGVEKTIPEHMHSKVLPRMSNVFTKSKKELEDEQRGTGMLSAATKKKE